jgi:hypothetical protein
MKTIITAVTVAFLSMGAFANDNEHPEKYCAKMKGGKKVVMHEGSEITSEVTLNNGTRIKPDGTITKSDGSTMTLKEGECMNLEGSVAKEKGMDKDKKDKKGKKETY